jgi:hypothetical protein
MEKALVDTDVIVDHLRGIEEARDFLRRVERGELEGYFSTITEAELFSGKKMESKAKQRKVSNLLGIMKRVPVNSLIARRAGEIKRRYGVPLPNAIIAATALRMKAKISTKNVKHFEGIEDITILEPY